MRTLGHAAKIGLLSISGVAAVGCSQPQYGAGAINGGDICQEAEAHAAECLGSELSIDCETDADRKVASEMASMPCGELLNLAQGAGKADFGCNSIMQKLGICKPARQHLACESALGSKVADAVWAAPTDHGTVPAEYLMGSRNAWVGPWVDAPEIFPKMADLIANARYEADLETFDWVPSYYDTQTDGWQNDASMILVEGIKRLEQRLISEDAKGLHPHLPVVLHFTTNGSDPNNPNGGVTAVHEIRALAAQLENIGIDPKYVDVHLGAHEHLLWGAVHSKLLVVDGVRAVVTGANPQPYNYIGNHWHDTAYEVVGEIAMGFQRDIDSTWDRSSEAKNCNTYDMKSVGQCEKSSNSRPDHVPEVASPNLDAIPELSGACTPMIAATRLPYAVNWGNPMSDSNPQDAAFNALLENAQSVIKIESPNLNSKSAKKRILDAVKRGVEVRVILSLGFNGFSERAKVAGIDGGGSNEDSVLSLYTDLANPALCERLKIRWNAKHDGKASWVQEPGASHTKYMTIDGKLAMVGSANQDTVSWHIIQETNVVVDSEAATAAYDAAVFDTDWQRAEGTDVLDWAAGLRDGTIAVWPDLDALLYGDAKAWATQVLTQCGR